MKQTRRQFLRGAIGWGGLLFAGSLEMGAVRRAEPLRRAHRYLAAQQSADGAWRSGRYAPFRDGDVLTPVVLWAMGGGGRSFQPLVVGSESGRMPLLLPSHARGLEWLRHLTDNLRGHDAPWSALHYPLFTASYAAQVFAREGDADRTGVWVGIIQSLRTGEELGWPVRDPMWGAWSDAAKPPRYATPVPDMLAPNISATVLAATALAAARCPSMTARAFVERCQNFSESQPTQFDDGGFFFALDDPIRNKAGRAGRDGDGRERFRSYGSATCDGYLALRACGLSRGHPRVRAAAEWLRVHGRGLDSAGDWRAGRAEARESLVYYQAQGLAAVLTDLPPQSDWVNALRDSLVTGLLAKQADDGSWRGLAPDSCEDEPLLATAFAARALALLTS